MTKIMATKIEVLINHDNTLVLVIRQWLSSVEASSLYTRLVNEVPWDQYVMNQFGKTINVPRLNFVVGDDNVKSYGYSKNTLPVVPWSTNFRDIRDIRDRIVTDTILAEFLLTSLNVSAPLQYDFCMMNYYPTGLNYIAYHSDREALGIANAVVTVSLGESRKFTLKRINSTLREPNTSTILHSGDLVLMAGTTQELYKHTITKTVKPIGGRISLTFRHIHD